jgi:hypothetical protein
VVLDVVEQWNYPSVGGRKVMMPIALKELVDLLLVGPTDFS